MIGSDQKKIRSLIRDNHNGQLYHHEELPNVVNTLVINIIESTDNDLDHSTIHTFIAQYLHYNNKEEKYYFNLKRKQVKMKEDFAKMLGNYIGNKLDNGSLNIEIVEEPVEPNESVVPLDQELIETDQVQVEQVQVKQVEQVEQVEAKLVKTIEETGEKPDKEVFIEIEEQEDSEDSEIDSDELLKLEMEFTEKFHNTNKKHSYSNYTYPIENKYTIIKRTNEANGPFGSQWVRDEQYDDVLDNILQKRALQFNALRAIVLPEQRTDAWFKMREGKITASDGGTVLGLNKYEKKYNFILKKNNLTPFQSNKFCYHGKKLEEPATMVYEYRMNVEVEEFGLMGHPKINFLGASPDGICSRYKYDKKHASKYVGRMLEIKCPFSRKINMDGPIINHICPVYYWVQVQLQLECCDLEECDFWQCDIREYNNKEEFVKDTNPKEPFMSLKYGFEKGCLIQLVPKKRMSEILSGKYWNVIYEDAIFIYPTKIEMSPHDCDIWIAEKMEEIASNPKYFDFVFDKVLYWRVEGSKNVMIARDRKWFAHHLPKFKQMWDYVIFFRNNKDKLNLLVEYIETQKYKKDQENKIMNIVDKLYHSKDPNYKKFLKSLYMEIEKDKYIKKAKRETKSKSKYMFMDNNVSSNQYMFVNT